MVGEAIRTAATGEEQQNCFAFESQKIPFVSRTTQAVAADQKSILQAPSIIITKESCTAPRLDPLPKEISGTVTD